MTENSNEPETPLRKGAKSHGGKRNKAAKSRGGKRSGAGRPAFRPSIEQRQTVEEMKFCGDSDEVIARAIGIDTDTLRKHFENELLDGYAQRRKEVVSLMFREARAGNASAIRRLEEIGRVANATGQPEKKADTSGGKLGKKEQQLAAAHGLSGKFTPPAAPRLAAVNGEPV